MYKITDLMTKGTINVDSGKPLVEAVSIMRKNNIGALVVETNGSVSGIFTERDLVKKMDDISGKDISACVVKDYYTKDLIKINSESTYIDAIEIMKEKRIRHIPVEKEGEIIGIVSLRDLMDHYNDQLEKQLQERQKALGDNIELLKDSEHKFRTMFDNSVVAIMLADKEEKIITWNSFTEELLGMDHKDLYHKPVKALYPKDEWDKMRAEKIREKGRKDLMETKVIKKDGSLIDVDISISVFKGDNGEVTGSVAVMRDNSDRKKAEGELKKSREYLEELVKERTIELEKINKQLQMLVDEKTKKFEETNTLLQKELVDREKTEEELARKMQNLSMLYSVSKALNFASDLKKILLFILDKARDALEAAKASLMLIDEKTNELVVHVVRGIPPEIEEKINTGRMECTRIKVGEGVAGEVALTKKYLLINDVKNDKRFKQSDQSFVESILCMPLIVNDEVIGVINLTNKQKGGQFDPEDVDLLSTLASQSAITIHNAKLYHLAITDGMTQLKIHRYFQQRLDEEIIRSEKFNHPLSLIMSDIDHFKKFNDTYGHQEGDIVLIETAKIFRLNVREVDIAARYGGEEFAVILPETDTEEALKIAEKLREMIEAHEYPSKEGKLKVTVSLGVSTYPRHAEKKEDLIEAADKALYVAKEGGRNQVRKAA